MRRKKFFRNIKTISKFGLFATIICFITMSSLVYLVNDLGFLSYVENGERTIVKLSF
jgi:hypothetical protein